MSFATGIGPAPVTGPQLAVTPLLRGHARLVRETATQVRPSCGDRGTDGYFNGPWQPESRIAAPDLDPTPP